MTRTAAYLDHSASTPLLPEARDAMVAALDMVGNPSSIHASGRAVRALIETAREAVAAAAGAEAGQVVFTSGATEAIATAILGGVTAFGIGRIVVGATEHAAVLRAAEATGLAITVLDVDAHGMVSLAMLQAAIAQADASGETLLVAVQAANNETGVVQPLAEIERLVGPTRHVLLIDAVQFFGRRPLDFSARGADMMAVSGHKVGGPAGIGALLVKSHADAVRLIPGGGQERGRRGGTEPVSAIAGFGAAAKAFAGRYDAERVASLANRLESEVCGLMPEAVIFGAGAARLEHTVAFALDGVANTTALMAFDLAGVALSSGSACSSGKVARSHVLTAMGVPPALADCALRASFGWSSVNADVDAFASALSTLLSRRAGRDGKAA